MLPTYVHPKLRRTFGRQCLFSDRHEILFSVPPDRNYFKENYVLRNPTEKCTQRAPEFAEVEVNTVRTEFSHHGMLHAQGGWPRDVNYLDEEQPVRYKRKIEKDDNYIKQVAELVGTSEHLVLSNHAVNIYEKYFEEIPGLEPPEDPLLDQVQLYTEPGTSKRPIRYISWSMDGGSHVACAHADMLETSSTVSYIWNVENTIAPVAVFHPQHQILSLEFNPKDPPILTSTMLNGQVAIWDQRVPKLPVAISLLEVSHRDRANAALWVNSKSGKEFFSGSSDGQVIFWDYRNFSETVDTLLMDPVKTDDQDMRRAQGVSVLEYETTIPTKFMVGTEQGMLFSCNRKGKSPIEKINFKLQCHFGPVLSLNRNPSYLKTFLTVGDWNAKIWSEDNRDNAISWTKNHKTALTSGCWSPGRCSLFFISRTDGVLDAWDFLQQQDSPVISLKVCDAPIRSIRSHDNSRIIACGSDTGNLHFVRVSDNLTQSAKLDKGNLTAMMDRESKREKIISDKMRELNLKLKTLEMAKNVDEVTESDAQRQQDEDRKINCKNAETNFYNQILDERNKKRIAYLGEDKENPEEEEEENEEEDDDDDLEDDTKAVDVTLQPEN